MLKNLFKKLDKWMEMENKDRQDAGTLSFGKARIRVLGQMALLEAKLELDLTGTVDVDAFVDSEGAVRLKFDQILKNEGLYLDPDSDKIWMPPDTEYRPFYKGTFVEAELAKVEYVMVSKAKMAPEKNAALLTQYLAEAADEKFLALAKKYSVNLERFL